MADPESNKTLRVSAQSRSSFLSHFLFSVRRGFVVSFSSGRSLSDSQKNKKKNNKFESTPHWHDGGLVDSPEISENQHAEESSSSAGLDDDDDDRPHKSSSFLPSCEQRIFFPLLRIFSEMDGSFHFFISPPPLPSFLVCSLCRMKRAF